MRPLWGGGFGPPVSCSLVTHVTTRSGAAKGSDGRQLRCERPQNAAARRRVAVQTRSLALRGYLFLAMRPSTILLKSAVPNETYSARFA